MPKVYNICDPKRPLDAVRVCRPTKWGNPFRPATNSDSERNKCCAKYRRYLLANKALLGDLNELAGKDLWCFCAPKRCHADFLLELANKPEQQCKNKSNVLLFYSGPLSQWFKKRFVVNGTTYVCVEQYVMAQKATLFGDKIAQSQIMSTENPRNHKKLGREVDSFNELVWNQNKRRIAFEGNLAKFTQNKCLKGELLSTGNFVLAEASLHDKVWGIGLSEKDARAKDPKNWKGENLLGQVLCEVREKIKKDASVQ